MKEDRSPQGMQRNVLSAEMNRVSPGNWDDVVPYEGRKHGNIHNREVLLCRGDRRCCPSVVCLMNKVFLARSLVATRLL